MFTKTDAEVLLSCKTDYLNMECSIYCDKYRILRLERLKEMGLLKKANPYSNARYFKRYALTKLGHDTIDELNKLKWFKFHLAVLKDLTK